MSDNESTHQIGDFDITVTPYGEGAYGCMATVGRTVFSAVWHEGSFSSTGAVQGVKDEDQLKPIPRVPPELLASFEKAVRERLARI
jgi:hypothetical protein